MRSPSIFAVSLSLALFWLAPSGLVAAPNPGAGWIGVVGSTIPDPVTERGHPLHNVDLSETAAQGTIQGQVTHAARGTPMVGAQVQVVGAGVGAITDQTGAYTIANVPAGEVEIEAQSVGFATARQTVTVSSDETVQVDFQLREQAIGLDAIIVTGTAGGKQARAIGNVVGRINASDLVEVSPAMNLEQLMSQRDASVSVLPGSGNVGSGAVTRIRGVSSISLSNQPLIYVDGVRVDNNPSGGPPIRQGRQASALNDIHPEDIESIEIIKGPAAATLYGTEASGGVIQIITKRGAEGAPQWDVRVRQGTTFLMDPEGKAPTVWGLDSAGQPVGVNLVQREASEGRPIFQYGHNQGYGLGLRGGTDMVRYYLSAGYDDTEGVVSYNHENRLNTRANLDVILGETFDISTSMGFVQAETSFAQQAAGWGIWDQIVWGTPTTLDTRNRGFLRATPEAVAELEATRNVNRFTGNVQATHRPRSWFTQRLNIGTDVGNETNTRLFPRHPTGSAYFFGGRSLGEKLLERNKNQFVTVDYASTVEYPLRGGLRGSTSIGGQYYTKRNEFGSMIGQEFPSPQVRSVGGAAVTFGNEDIVENKTVGMYVEQGIDWENRLFITGAIRGDDNSAFGAEYEAAIYPKMSATWVMHEEPFWTLDWVSQFRVRTAFGTSGQQPDVFAAIRLYQPETGPGDQAVLTPEAIGNPELGPEKGQEFEIGFDAGMFDDRLGIEYTFYSQRTKDAIVSRGLPVSSGFPGGQFVNVGELSNRGMEFVVNYRVMDRDRFSWETAIVYATNRNRVEDLGGLPPISLGTQQHREGYPIGSVFDIKVVEAEFGPDGELSTLLCAGGPENDHQPVSCDSAPRVFWGVPNPRWEGGFTNTFSFGRHFRLNTVIDFRGGHMTRNGDIHAAHGTFRNSQQIVEGSHPFVHAYANELESPDPLGYVDAGFAKLREIALSYDVPERWLGSAGVSRASITVAGRNLATLWTEQDNSFGYPIPDPEVRTPGSELSNYVQTVLPPFSQINTTLRVTF